MAFVCTLKASELNAEVFRRGGEATVLHSIGYDVEADRTYSLQVGLSPGVAGILDYFFNVIEVENGGAEDAIWDSTRTAKLFSSLDRVFILRALQEITKILICNINPKEFAFSTYLPNLPEKAMKKYHLLLGLFKDLGYHVSEYEPYNGIRAWSVERLE